jgi:hypothetical protein
MKTTAIESTGVTEVRRVKVPGVTGKVSVVVCFGDTGKVCGYCFGASLWHRTMPAAWAAYQTHCAVTVATA